MGRTSGTKTGVEDYENKNFIPDSWEKNLNGFLRGKLISPNRLRFTIGKGRVGQWNSLIG